MAEANAGRVSTMLAANANAHPRTGRPAFPHGQFQQAPHTRDVQRLEGVVGQDAPVEITDKEVLLRVVPAEPKGHLGQVVGAEGEELGHLGDFPGREGRPWHLNHGAKLIGNLQAMGFHDLSGHLLQPFPDGLEFVHMTHQRNHHLRQDLHPFLPGPTRGFENGPNLHLGNLGVKDGQAHTPQTHHGVDFVEFLDLFQQHLGLFVHFLPGAGLGHPFDQFQQGGKELVEGRIQEADNDGKTVHHPEQAQEVLHLMLEEGFQRGLTFVFVFGQDEAPHVGKAVGFEEHVLGAAQPDTFGPQTSGQGRVFGQVRVGPHLQAPSGTTVHLGPHTRTGGNFIGPVQQDAQFFQGFQGRRLGRQLPHEHLPRGAVHGNPGSLRVLLAVDLENPALHVDFDVRRAHHRGDAELPGHHRGVGRCTAFGRHNGLGDQHGRHVFGLGKGTHENHRLALGGFGLGLLGVQIDAAHGRTRRSVNSPSQQLPFMPGLGQIVGIELRVEQLLHIFGGYATHGFFFGNQSLVHHIHGHLHLGLWRGLARPSLEHPHLPPLDGELDVLHGTEVALQTFGHVLELSVCFGHLLGQLGHRGGGPHTGHHVLALGVHQVFAPELLFTCAGVAGEDHPGTRIRAQVPKHHGHDVHCGAQVVGNARTGTVGLSARAVPGAEHRFHGHPQLFVGVLGKLPAMEHVHTLETTHHPLPGRRVQLSFLLRALFRHLLFQRPVEVLFGESQYRLAEHLQEAPISIPGEARVVGHRRQAVDGFIIQAHVEDGVHHPWHGKLGP